MKKKLLVVGDSFMKPDFIYPGQHWSEMLQEYDIIMNSQSGASNGIIAHKFYQGLEQDPDLVVLGFSFPGRLEFLANGIITTGNDPTNTTSEQRQVADAYRIHVPAEMQMIKECSVAAGMLSLLERNHIPYAWTLGGLFNNYAQLPYPSDPWVNKILGEFLHKMTATNLSAYPKYKASPGFHTDDPEWQKRFAQEVREILQTH